MYLSRFPWRALLLLWQLRIFAAAAARSDPTPPPFVGGGKYQKNKIACSVGDGFWTFLCRRGRGQGRGVLYGRDLSVKDWRVHWAGARPTATARAV